MDWQRDKWGLSYPKIGIGRSGRLHLVWVGEIIGYGAKDGEAWQAPKVLGNYDAITEPTIAIGPDEGDSSRLGRPSITRSQPGYFLYGIQTLIKERGCEEQGPAILETKPIPVTERVGDEFGK